MLAKSTFLKENKYNNHNNHIITTQRKEYHVTQGSEQQQYPRKCYHHWVIHFLNEANRQLAVMMINLIKCVILGLKLVAFF